jgi:hypothetical protein
MRLACLNLNVGIRIKENNLKEMLLKRMFSPGTKAYKKIGIISRFLINIRRKT